MLRRLLIVTVVLAGIAGVASPRVLAATPCPDTQALSTSSSHFTVTYDDDPSKAGAITQVDAQNIVGQAERAYASYTALGFPAPPVTLSGKTEIDVVDLSGDKVSAIYCGDTVDVSAATATEYTVDGVLFGMIAQGYGVSDQWLSNGLNSWAAYRVLGYPESSIQDLGPWEMSIDCESSGPTTGVNCSKTDSYADLGLSRWPFFEYLDERFGDGFMRELMGDAAGNGNGIAGIQTALVAHGTTLAAAYSAFTTKLLVGGWSVPVLNTALPPVSATILTGAATGNTAAQSFSVGHLATRFIEIDRGDGDASHKCYTATLNIKVVIPSGVTSQPVFYWAAANNASVPLTISGTNATASVPWDTCSWSTHGYLSLPNTTTSADGAVFQVSTHIDVTTTEVTATPPSTPANGYGNATDVGSVTGVPSISVFGPLVLKLPSTSTQIELVVEASDQGAVGAALGSLDLGKAALVPGENVVKFAVPKGALQTLRASSAAGANVLTLTPTSSDGRTTGTAVRMTVSVLPAAKAKKPAKKHAKKPAKKKH